MSETVHEDDQQRGPARTLTVTARIEPDTGLRVSLPDVETGLPYVLRIGRADVHLYMERAELERLHALIGRVLEQDAADAGGTP